MTVDVLQYKQASLKVAQCLEAETVHVLPVSFVLLYCNAVKMPESHNSKPIHEFAKALL